MYETRVRGAGRAGDQTRPHPRPHHAHPRAPRSATRTDRAGHRSSWVAGEAGAGYDTTAHPDDPGDFGVGDTTREQARSPRAQRGSDSLARAATTPGSPLGQALGALAAATDALAAVDIDAEHPDVTGDALVGLHHLTTRLHHTLLATLESFDRRDAYTADAAVTAGAWLAARTGSDHHTTTRLVHTARRLADLPRINAHLAAGDLSPAHAAAITHAATPPPRAAAITHAEDILADLACTNPPRDLRHALRRLTDTVDPDGSDPHDPHQAHGDPLRELRLHTGYARRGELHATLDPLTREALTVLLDAFTTPDPPDTQRRTPSQRRHDALATLLHTLLGQPRLPSVQGARPTILLTLDLATLLALPPDHPLAGLTLPDLAATLGLDTTDLGLPPDPTEPTEPTEATDQDGPTQATRATDPDEATDQDARGKQTEDPDEAHDTHAHHAPVQPDRSDRPDAGDNGPGPPPPPQRPPRLGSGVDVPIETVHRLLPAATLMAVITLGPWRAVNVGAKHRTLPACQPHHKLTEKGWRTTLDHTTGEVTWTNTHTGRTITVPPPRS